MQLKAHQLMRKCSNILDAQAILASIKGIVRQAKHLRGRVRALLLEQQNKPGVRGLGKVYSNSAAAVDRRVSDLFKTVAAALEGREDREQALFLNRLIESRSLSLHRLLRNSTNARICSYVRRERFIAVRWAIKELRNNHWTAENWLELRLKKFLKVDVFRWGARLFSRKLDQSTGQWLPQMLLPLPDGSKRSREEGIFHALRVPSPFRNDAAMKQALDDLLTVGDKKCINSPDGRGVSFNPHAMMRDCLNNAKSDNNVAAPIQNRRLRMQVLFDAVGFYRGGRMATRFGVRLVDMIRFHNSPYYFRNIALYLSGDHYSELKEYLGGVFAELNSGFIWTKLNTVDELGQAEYSAKLTATLDDEEQTC
eukprot:6186150-Pleurochrysis_carterae.AAC.1